MAPAITYNPDEDIPDLSGRVFLITGGTAGIGKQAITTLAKHNPQRIYFTGRNTKSAETVISEVKHIAPNVTLTFIECDQASLASVNHAADTFFASNPARLDVLICNAGVMGPPAGLTKDGYENHFGINYLAHALLTKRLLPLLESTAKDYGEARLINLTSAGYALHPGGIPFAKLKTRYEDISPVAARWARYGLSKFATVLYTTEFAQRHPSITAVSVNPGVIYTNLVEGLGFFDRWFIKSMTIGQSITAEQGCYTTVWAATSKIGDGLKGGGIYQPVGVEMKRTNAASDTELQGKLWEWTEQQFEGLI